MNTPPLPLLPLSKTLDRSTGNPSPCCMGVGDDAPASLLGAEQRRSAKARPPARGSVRGRGSPSPAACLAKEAAAPTPFPSPAAPPFCLQWHPGGLRQYSHMSVTCACAQPMGVRPRIRVPWAVSSPQHSCARSAGWTRPAAPPSPTAHGGEAGGS